MSLLVALLLIFPEADPPPGKALAAHFECNRCHESDQWTPPPAEKQCVGCHVHILAGTFDAAPEHIKRWQGRLVSLNRAPSLQGMTRFQRSWLVQFLSEPNDLRPALPAMMPRFAFGPGDAQDLASWLAFPDETRVAPVGDAARGRLRFGELGCGLCHAFTGADLPPLSPPVLAPEVVGRGVPLAPDLRITRARFRPSALARWIQQPQAIKADSAMPALPMTAADAGDLAAWIYTTPLGSAPVVPLPVAPPVLDRPVKWPEVEAHVFKHVCWHCHSDPAFAVGDGGPGNTGGFGFAPRGLNLATYQGISSGLVDATGKRRSVFAPGPDGSTPLLIAALMARHAEVAGQPVPGVRGMPLGLPPIPLEDIQRVITWVAQGRPR